MTRNTQRLPTQHVVKELIDIRMIRYVGFYDGFDYRRHYLAIGVVGFSLGDVSNVFV